jgi:malate dehydrogenase
LRFELPQPQYNAPVTVVILGAGDIGAALARQIASADVVSSITLVDEAAGVAAGKALDIAQAGAVDGYGTALAGTDDVSAVAGRAVVVLADRAGSPAAEWQGEPGLALLKRVAALAPPAPIVCAGASGLDLVERGVGELGIPRARLFGSAPEALRSAVQMMTALEAGAAAPDVSVAVLGRPPRQIIVSWDDASIAGRRATDVLSAAQLARLDARVARLWPPGPVALATAAARLVRTALERSTRVHMAFVGLTRDEGTPGRAAMLPVVLQPSGIVQVIAPALTPRDRVRLETVLRA